MPNPDDLPALRCMSRPDFFPFLRWHPKPMRFWGGAQWGSVSRGFLPLPLRSGSYCLACRRVITSGCEFLLCAAPKSREPLSRSLKLGYTYVCPPPAFEDSEHKLASLTNIIMCEFPATARLSLVFSFRNSCVGNGGRIDPSEPTNQHSRRVQDDLALRAGLAAVVGLSFDDIPVERQLEMMAAMTTTRHKKVRQTSLILLACTPGMTTKCLEFVTVPPGESGYDGAATLETVLAHVQTMVTFSDPRSDVPRTTILGDGEQYFFFW